MSMTRRKMMPHQEKCLRENCSTRLIALLLDMRLGKTLVAIRWARQYESPYLVVCPLSVVQTWIDELKLEGRIGVPLLGSQEQRQETFLQGLERSRRWFVTNYEALFIPGGKNALGNPILEPSWIAGIKWPTVLLDESVKIRNGRTMTSQVCCNHLSRAKNKAILSGLPNPEGPLDFFHQFRFLLGSFMGHTNFWEFRHEHFEQYGFKWVPKPGSSKLIRKFVHANAAVVTRRQVNLGGKVTRTCRYVYLPEKSRTAYDELEKYFAYGDATTKWTVARYVWMRQVASGFPKNTELPVHNRKLDILVPLLKNELAGEQCLVWYVFDKEGAAVEGALRKAGVSVRRISGDVSVDLRDRHHRDFRLDRFQVLCVQVSCGQYGLDLSNVSTAIYFSEPTSHNEYAQSIDRTVHPQKKHPLFVISVVAAGTIEVDIHNALLSKRCTSQTMLDTLMEGIRARWKVNKKGKPKKGVKVKKKSCA